MLKLLARCHELLGFKEIFESEWNSFFFPLSHCIIRIFILEKDSANFVLILEVLP